MAAQQNQINLGKENLIPLQVMGSCLPFLLFPGLFKIIAQSAYGSAIPSVWMYVGVVRKWFVCDFWHFGILFSTKKGTNQTYQSNVAALGLSSALKAKKVKVIVWYS